MRRSDRTTEGPLAFHLPRSTILESGFYESGLIGSDHGGAATPRSQWVRYTVRTDQFCIARSVPPRLVAS